MNRDTIIKLAREAKAVPHAKDAFGTPTAFSASVEDLERFAALVAAAEREACAETLDRNAQVCRSNSMLRDVLEGNAAAIRARSQA